MQRHLHIDIETYSETDLSKAGVYRYSADPSFRIRLIAYAWDHEPVRCIAMPDDGPRELPEWLAKALTDAEVVKHAHNATFERVCFSLYMYRNPAEFLDPSQWRCSMVKAAYCGLPLSLGEIGKALGFEQQKMTEGRRLIQLFSVPQKVRGGLFASEPMARAADYPQDWETFQAYCIRDVEVEMEIEDALSWYEITPDEQALYALDQRINDRGVRIDMEIARNAETLDALAKARLGSELEALTGIDAVNSNSQLKAWVEEQLGYDLDNIDKTTRADLIKTAGPVLRRVLELKQQLSKTSNSKYTAMRATAGSDDRARGLLQFFGTATGRWAGRLVQMQNLPQNHIELATLNEAREAVKKGDIDTIELHFGDVPDTLSQLIRTAFIPSEGKVFAVCDFSAIEARVLAWAAGEQWVLDTFRNGGDIYCATASQMFHVPAEKHGRNAELRQKGKIAVLALGYGGGAGALEAMGGQRMGMTKAEEDETVRLWREANPSIVQFWRNVQDAAINAIKFGRTVTAGRYSFSMEDDTLVCQLPSGRKLCYKSARLATNRVGGQSLKYQRVDSETHKWGWAETYGGKLTENLIQATARDVLAHTMRLVNDAGISIVFHVHDELVMEVDSADKLKDIEAIFAKVPAWAEGLPLKGAGYTGNYYFKD